jgi:HEAT repeat protein
MLWAGQHIVGATVGVALAVLLVTAVFVFLTLQRRAKQSRYLQELDDIRNRYAPLLRALLNGEVDCRTGADQLRRAWPPEHLHALERLFLAALENSGQVARAADVAEALGLVSRWQRQLRGEAPRMRVRDELTQPEHWLEERKALQFIVRARAAENLRRVGHRRSWPLLAEALSDPHPEVQSVVIRALGALGEPDSFPLLVQRLHEVVLNSNQPLVSVRTLKAALARFPLELTAGLLPSLNHRNPRIRFLAVSIICDMAQRDGNSQESQRPNWPPQVAEALLDLTRDDNSDVRARAAEAISYLEDPRVLPALKRLAEDSTWFVRLRAVRAAAGRREAGAEEILVEHLTDSHWRVREAAVQGCVRLGQRGLQKLVNHFRVTRDRYSREQIAEEIERCSLKAPAATESAKGNPTLVLRMLLEGVRQHTDRDSPPGPYA